MLTSRRMLILVLAGVLILAGALWVASRHGEEETVLSQPLLANLKSALNGVTEVRLTKGDATHTVLKKGASGWSVAERDYPADTSKVRKLLLDLADLKGIEEKTRDPASYAQIGVEAVNGPTAGGTQIDIVAPAGSWSIIIGKPSATSASYVRLTAAPASWLAAPQIAVDPDPRHWLDHDLIDVPESRVQEVSVKPATGPAYVISRKTAKDADFTVTGLPKGRELSSAGAADSIASALAALTLDDVRKTTGLGTEPVQAILQTFDGLTLTVGGLRDGERRLITLAAKSSDKATADEAAKIAARFTGWEIEIPGYKYDSLFRPLEELLKKPPEPARKAAAKASPAKPAASKLPFAPPPATPAAAPSSPKP